MADIIDNASTLEYLQREAALSMHRLNPQQYQQRTVRNAVIASVTSAGKRIRDARCV
jgi:hypothetical protein